MHIKRFILTGTPGCAKTSVIKELKQLGKNVIHEAATDVIALEQGLGQEHPWKFPDFIDKIIELQKQRQDHSLETIYDYEFYDRSPICTYALCQYLGFTLSKTLMDEIERIQNYNIYNKKVLFLENLDFVENTEARKINFAEALKFEVMHLDAYRKFGYKCMIIPKMPISKRAQFILDLMDNPF